MLAARPSAHLQTWDNWGGFSAESYAAVESFTLEMNTAVMRRAGMVALPVRRQGHLCRWRFHHGVRFRT